MAVTGVKRKRVSKKTKQSWRKYTKINDIEDFLDEQRDEERLGAPLEVLSNEELFVVDSTPQTSLLSSKEKRKLRATRPLKCFAALQPHTKVPDPIKKRNRVKTSEERKSSFVKPNENLKLKKMTALAERRLDEIKREQKQTRGEYTKDIWNSNNVHPIQKDPWANTTTKIHNLRNTGISIKNVTNDLKLKKSILPAIDIPHPGMSYNPSFKDHQELLQIVAKEEMKTIKEEKHLQRVTRDMFRKITQDKKEDEWLIEMSQELDNKISTETSDTEDLDKISINPPAKNKKKTLKQRRKQKEQLELEKQRKLVKLEKKKVGDIQRLKGIKMNIEKVENKQQKLRELRKIKAEKKKKEPKVLSAMKIDDPGLDFQLGENISGNLRGLQKEGNLLSDRFISMQKRNILQASRRAHKKKAKVKKYTKSGHKENWEATVARKNKLIQK
ncbi:hypothetical protein GWI33_004654 [Rhynchophorus ferrugineus]|uniref:Ribosome biogenesis protein NOP53 n=1 Tax=Rhynchophorus ferrugineus TaxID=354439 RepID=A0A834J2R1_RHYFE|nr:hypothetical protein GWI33_004654 [Rhynchophorus ferrugineus]